MGTLISFIAISWFFFLPVYLWGYMMSIFLENEWNRTRFWMGTLIGGFTVVLVYVFSLLQEKSLYIQGVSLLGFFIILYLGVWVLVRLGSVYARGFLLKIAGFHSLFFFAFFLIFFAISTIFGDAPYLSSSILALFFAAYIEESAKHLSSIGFLGKNFSFSQKDVILLTVLVVLGFTFTENMLYLASSAWGAGEWMMRSFFTTFAHIFLSSICAYFWWKALSEKPFSLRYFLYFFLGFGLSGGLHFLYNYLLETQHIVLVILFLACGYIVFTRFLVMTPQKISDVRQS